jgi:hypothetical protein
VEQDARKGYKKVLEWIEMVLKPNKNNFGITYKKFHAYEQEFNTYTYGIKGKIDATI